jgi:Fe-S-cluster containining protein
MRLSGLRRNPPPGDNGAENGRPDASAIDRGPAMSRQQRRKLERELMKLAGDVRRTGLPVPHRPEATMVLALAVREELAGTSPTRAARAALLIEQVFDLTLCRLPLACAEGCAFCCHNVVMATAPEVFHAANTLRARHDATLVAGVRGRCDAVRPARDAGARPPCPLLASARCSVYAARPAVCRKHTSLAVGACRSEHEGRPARIPIRRFDQQVFECCAVALITGMRLWDGRPGAVLELSAALRIALDDPAAEQKWLAGEDVFAGVAQQTQLPGIDEHAAFIWSRLAGQSA